MRIERLNYSREPWRLVTSGGGQVYRWVEFDHPGVGMTAIQAPIAGATRRQCEERALELLERLLLDEQSRGARREGLKA